MLDEQLAEAKSWSENGNCPGDDAYNLFMAPVKRSGWMNIYSPYTAKFSNHRGGGVYDTEELAKECISDKKTYSTTIKIEWEE